MPVESHKMSRTYKEDAPIEQPAVALYGDDLLPKLISGEVDVSALDIDTGDRAT